MHFDSRRFDGDPAPPGVALLQLRLGAAELPPRADAAALVTPHDQNTLQLSFSALSFTDQSGVNYQARMDGVDPDWYDSPAREVRYASLSPGDYRLQLRARYRDGDWGPVTTLALTVQPAWWQTTGFRLGLAGGLLMLLWALERRRVARHRAQTAQLEQLVVSRTEALAVANAQLREQSLTDPLTQLHNRRYLQEVMARHVAEVNRALRGQALRQARLAPPGEGLVPPGEGLVLMMVDGHAAGDLVLQQIATLLRDCTRESDTVARWGGEEFAVVARQAGPQDAAVLAERIRAGGGARVPARRRRRAAPHLLHRLCDLPLHPGRAAAPGLGAAAGAGRPLPLCRQAQRPQPCGGPAAAAGPARRAGRCRRAVPAAGRGPGRPDRRRCTGCARQPRRPATAGLAAALSRASGVRDVLAQRRRVQMRQRVEGDEVMALRVERELRQRRVAQPQVQLHAAVRRRL